MRKHFVVFVAAVQAVPAVQLNPVIAYCVLSVFFLRIAYVAACCLHVTLETFASLAGNLQQVLPFVLA